MDIKGLLSRKPKPTKKEIDDDGSCKIKIKRNARGEEMTFSSGCSPKQREMAMENLSNKNQLLPNSSDD